MHFYFLLVTLFIFIKKIILSMSCVNLTLEVKNEKKRHFDKQGDFWSFFFCLHENMF